jgi:glycosyltransferase involved in cell wall biosynthesis
MKKVSVSVVISAYNEEKKIVDCLESVAWADEIIVIDNTSSDKTAELAEKHRATVYTRENNLMLNVNKNWGFHKARNEWVLSLDADERVTPELAEEIMTHSLQNDKNITGYWIPRKNIIFGKVLMHTGWYPDYQLRLFKKEYGQFDEKHVHEMITLQGEAGYLQHAMMHYNYESLAQFLRKTMTIYAPNEASELLRKGYVFNYLDSIRMPLNEFLSRYFAREGYKDGFHGLMISLLMSMYHLIVFANIWEIQGFKDHEQKNMFKQLEKEMRKSYKDIIFWITKVKLQEGKNPLRAVLLKVKRKLPIL